MQEVKGFETHAIALSHSQHGPERLQVVLKARLKL